jgi:hypothetical protein
VILPTSQGFVGAHGLPTWHGEQTPAAQASLVPQLFPSEAGPASVHTAEPLAHE